MAALLMESRARAGNLTAALVFVSFLELVLNRLANRLFLPRSMISGASAGTSMLARALGDSGPFLFHLTGVLAFSIFVLALAGLLRRRELFPRTVRFTVIVIGAAFWLLGTTAVLFGQVPRGFALHLETSFGFLSLLTAAAFLGSRAAPRVKVGVMLFALPGALHVTWLVLEQLGRTRGSGADLSRWGEGCLLLAAATAPFTLLPRRRAGDRGWMAPLAVAVALTLLLSLALATRYDLVQTMAFYGLHLEIPRLSSPMGMGYLAGTLGWVYAVGRLIGQAGGSRLAGYGLLLLAIAGYQVGSPLELSLSLLGLFALSVGELRAAGASATVGGTATSVVGPADWRRVVGQIAGAIDDGSAADAASPEAIVVEEDDLEVSRLRSHRRGHAIGLRFLRRRGRVAELEISVGDPGHLEPTATIERHRSWLARSPEQRLALPRLRTGDPSFDQKFSVHGAVALHSDDLRRRIGRQGAGVLSLWQGTAARYRAVHPGGDGRDKAAHDPPFAPGFGARPSDLDAMVALVDTWIDLTESKAG
jgi:hypothetical protein